MSDFVRKTFQEHLQDAVGSVKSKAPESVRERVVRMGEADLGTAMFFCGGVVCGFS